MRINSVPLLVAVLLTLATALQSASANTEGSRVGTCPGMSVSGWGVLDYRTVDRTRLQLVERYHFTPDVEQLQSHRAASDLSYTLRRFQNHHRALMSMMNLGLREKMAQPNGAQYSVECYLLRAEHLFPNDAMVKMIHGLYMMRSGQPARAIEKLESARKLNVADANLHYNLGLAYLDLRQYDKALESAHQAYALGFPLPGLRDRLKRAGRWRDPN